MGWKCWRIRHQIALMAGDDLTGPAQSRVEAHLQKCPRCRQELEALKASLRALAQVGQMDPLPAAPELWLPLQRRLDLRTSSSWLRASRARRLRRAAVALSTLAAALLVGFGLWWERRKHPRPSSVDRVISGTTPSTTATADSARPESPPLPHLSSEPARLAGTELAIAVSLAQEETEPLTGTQLVFRRNVVTATDNQSAPHREQGPVRMRRFGELQRRYRLDEASVLELATASDSEALGSGSEQESEVSTAHDTKAQ
jgi:hypothetical protein